MLPRRVLCTTAACLAAVVFASGCSRPDGEPAKTPAERAVVHAYTVRGQIAVLPAPDRPLDELQIRHEHIPHFADREGNVYVNSRGVRGMGSMTMPFPVADSVSLDGLEVGDKVEFTFEQRWIGESRSYALTEIAKLPEETELDFTTPVGDPPAEGG